ncbi:MAG: DEDD exonuclease domain-containing protein [Actinomycetota bacterium]|nr:DEDD exonuclease domain-containing protein [Actinomycetota bacterium]
MATGTVAQIPRQGTFDELGTPLREITFVVVDLETTGGSAASCAITEVGAVKVRGGEVLGSFQTLVNPGDAIPPFIAVLTGITDSMVATAPRAGAVLPAFLEFARGSVLVAHNAPFDLGFLRTGCQRLGLAWPAFDSVDTARLARRVLTRDEAPDCKLSTLARLFRTEVAPCHRALADAQATVDVLHGLFGRLGGLGVHSLEELKSFSAQVSPEQRRKRHLADGLPHAPGVYVFRDVRGRPLYVGKSTDLGSRVRHYFVASEPRTRMAEMVGLAERVDVVLCAHGLEAEVRELRLIAEHKPRYNRRSRFPESAVYLKLTVEPFPRLSLVRRVLDDAATYLGPFGSRRTAELALAALHEALPLRQCTGRLSPRRRSPACVLAEMGRCGAPCTGAEGVASYAEHADAARRAISTDPHHVVDALARRIGRLGEQQRFEDAASHRDRLAAFVRAAARLQRLSALARCRLLVAARPSKAGGWELAVVTHGRLTAAGVVPPAAAPRPYVEALVASAEVAVPAAGGPTPCAAAEEMECVLRWLERAGTRLVELDGEWSSPARGAGGLHEWLGAADRDRAAARPFADRRRLRPTSRPARG